MCFINGFLAKLKFVVFSFIVFSFALIGYGEKRVIFTTILPQKWLVDGIVSNKFEVLVIVERGRDPHTFEVSPSLVKKVGKAEVFFSLGLGDSEENLIRKVRKSFPKVRVVDMSEGLSKLALSEKHFGKEHHYYSGLYDPHVWLSPLNMIVMASNILKVVVGLDPQNRDFYEENYRNTVKKLKELHEEIGKILYDLRGRKFLVFHSAFKYFEKEYGVVEIALEREGKDPSPRELVKILKVVKEEGIKVVFVQPGFSRKSAEVLAKEIRGTVVEINPLEYDYLENMRRIAILIRDSYR
ncbi:MAG: zinc ABC transporter substrate-binding protein [Brevinematia bacterium]